MNKELFGVFGDEARFRRYRSPGEFDVVVEGESTTVGVRDPGLAVPDRTSIASGDAGTCVVWGEAYTPPWTSRPAAAWLLERFAERGPDALAGLNGSYLAVVDRGETALVATDPIRTWECFYADLDETRVFGTDPVAVARTIPSPTVRTAALLELFHLSVVTGDRTIIRQLHRVPFDGYLERDSTAELDRFVYAPREFDYVGELAARLQRAMARRSRLPGRTGLLLSGGYDSRTILAGLDNLDCAYTIGPVDGEVVGVARRVATQYDTPHRVLPVDERYLRTDPDTIRYGQGLKESIHIHHAGYTADMDVETMFHALLFDTVLRGHFLPRDDVSLLGRTVPRSRLDPDPDVFETILSRYGILPESETIFPNCDAVDEASGAEFVRSVVEDRLSAQAERYDSVYNAIELFGIQNQPTTPFRTHLADTHFESFIAADAELLEWHLATPPAHRNTRTFVQAIERIDGTILRHPPHDRPSVSPAVNGIERFLRRKLPFVDPFDPAWPDHRKLYDRRGLDERLFPEHPEVHNLPSRLKLRINDITGWLAMATDGAVLSPPDVICPPITPNVPRRAVRSVAPMPSSTE